MAKLSVCIDLVMEDIPFLERIDRVADSGYEALEFWGWTGKDLPAILKRKQAHGLEISLINCSAKKNVKFEDWRFPCLTDPQNREEYLSAVEESAEVAVMLGSPNLNTITGCAQPHLSWDAQRASVVYGLREAAALAEQKGVALTIEALNTTVDHPDYFLETVKDTVDVLEEVGHPNVKMLFDIYHQQVTEGYIIQKITENIEYIGYIHIADVPGRHQPGTGELNYRNIVKAIDKSGYAGYVGLEYSPLGDMMDSLAETRAILCPPQR